MKMLRFAWTLGFWIFSLAHGMELNPDNYDLETAGKVVFINFYSPTCGHCMDMKEAWEKLTEDYAGHEKYLVASVNCQTQRQWCRNTFSVKGYPSLRFGNPAHKGILLDEYETKRDYETLSEFATEMFAKPSLCTIDNKENCSSEVNERLATLAALPEGYTVKRDTFEAIKSKKVSAGDPPAEDSVQSDEL